MERLDYAAAFRGCTDGRARGFVAKCRGQSPTGARSKFTTKQLDYLDGLIDKGTTSARPTPDGLPAPDQGPPTVSPCTYAGCAWTGRLADWWDHAHVEHGRALPHFLDPLTR